MSTCPPLPLQRVTRTHCAAKSRMTTAIPPALAGWSKRRQDDWMRAHRFPSPRLNEWYEVVRLCADLLPLPSRWALAATCTEVRVALADLFDEWDHDLVARLGETIAPYVQSTGAFEMERVYGREYQPWPREDDALVLQRRFVYRCGMSHVFEHGHVRADLSYRQEVRGNTDTFTAVPCLSDPVFEAVNALCSLNASCDWAVHPDFLAWGTCYLMGKPLDESGRVVYVREHMNVTARATLALHPRVVVDVMGNCHIPREHYGKGRINVRTHINLHGIRLYARPALLTEAMRARA